MSVAAPLERDMTYEAKLSQTRAQRGDSVERQPWLPPRLALILALGLFLRLGLAVWLYGTPLNVSDDHIDEAVALVKEVLA